MLTSDMKRLLAAMILLVVAAHAIPAEAARPRRMSAAQKKELQYRQQEIQRYQREVAAKEREVYLSFDENGNGKLEGVEKAKYDKLMRQVQLGTAPNPLATIVPPGLGPRDPKANSSAKK